MRSIIKSTFFFLFLASSFSIAQTGYGLSPKFYGGLNFGYNGGFGGQLNFTMTSFQSGFPLSIRFGFGYTNVDPGRPADARKIFINDATNGTPEENGYIWDLRFDLMLPVNVLYKSNIYLGPRYSMFKKCRLLRCSLSLPKTEFKFWSTCELPVEQIIWYLDFFKRVFIF